MKDKYINNSKENKNYTIRNKYVRLIFILMHLTFFVVMMIYYEKNKLIFFTATSFWLSMTLPALSKVTIFKLFKINDKKSGKVLLAMLYLLATILQLHLSFEFNEHDKYILAVVISMLYGPIIAYNLSPILDIFDDELKDLK
ncbi:MAG: hypothetical protein HXM31_05285 [Haemophilus parainfluenzae]|jgi:hypothetical protein|nr:hypothetical protein [Haemophilus parainfluenzae]